jgi:hypothetical protein
VFYYNVERVPSTNFSATRFPKKPPGAAEFLSNAKTLKNPKTAAPRQ